MVTLFSTRPPKNIWNIRKSNKKYPRKWSDSDSLGSADAGQTVKCENPIISQKMKQAAKLLNLKGHQVQDKTIFAAVDVEIHQHKVTIIPLGVTNNTFRLKVIVITCLIALVFSRQKQLPSVLEKVLTYIISW